MDAILSFVSVNPGIIGVRTTTGVSLKQLISLFRFPKIRVFSYQKLANRNNQACDKLN